MSLFIATGTNLGERKLNLEQARDTLSQHLTFIAESRIFESPAVDYLNQPDFYNQVLEFKIPEAHPEAVMDLLLKVEADMGRSRTILRGPRIIDLDMLFWGEKTYSTPKLILPHPRLFERSFVVLPLSELPGFKLLEKNFSFKFSFDNSAIAIS